MKCRSEKWEGSIPRRAEVSTHLVCCKQLCPSVLQKVPKKDGLSCVALVPSDLTSTLCLLSHCTGSPPSSKLLKSLCSVFLLIWLSVSAIARHSYVLLDILTWRVMVSYCHFENFRRNRCSLKLKISHHFHPTDLLFSLVFW